MMIIIAPQLQAQDLVTEIIALIIRRIPPCLNSTLHWVMACTMNLSLAIPEFVISVK